MSPPYRIMPPPQSDIYKTIFDKKSRKIELFWHILDNAPPGQICKLEFGAQTRDKIQLRPQHIHLEMAGDEESK